MTTMRSLSHVCFRDALSYPGTGLSTDDYPSEGNSSIPIHVCDAVAPSSQLAKPVRYIDYIILSVFKLLV